MSTKADNDSNFFSKTWELNIYELNRMPHEIIYDETQIAVSPKILQNELMCPICLDILKDTMTTKECLHRFCHDCIITALRAGNKECPTCRKKLVSKRSLRPDPNIDGIISIIYPNREELDALHEKVLEKLNKKHLTAINGVGGGGAPSSAKVQRQNSKRVAPQQRSSTKANSNNNLLDDQQQPSTSNGISRQGTKRNNRVLSNSEADSDQESRSEMSSQLNHDPEEIEVTLKPHPDKESKYSMEKFIKTAPIASVDHLSIYLTSRVGIENSASNSFNPIQTESKSFSIYANDPKSDALVELPSSITLEQIIEKYSKQPANKVIDLYYSYINQ